MSEKFKGFTIHPYFDKGRMMDELEEYGINAEETATTEKGFIYKFKNIWYDTRGSIPGLEYIL